MMVVVLGMVVVVLGIVVVVGMAVTKQREVCIGISFFSKMTSNPRLRKLGEIEGTDGLVALFGGREGPEGCAGRKWTEGCMGVGRGTEGFVGVGSEGYERIGGTRGLWMVRKCNEGVFRVRREKTVERAPRPLII